MSMNTLRAIAANSRFRRFFLHPRIRGMAAAAFSVRFLTAARATTTPWRYLINQFLGRASIYTVRVSDVRIRVQPGPMAETFHEVFMAAEYEPPSAFPVDLPESPEILDIGANVGMFSAFALGRWPTAKITAFEPDDVNAADFRAWRELNAARDVELVEACASISDKPIPFALGFGSGGHAARRDETFALLPAVDILPYMVVADLVKIDIEGGEWTILRDPRLSTVGSTVLVMEYHRVNAPFLPAIDAATQLLERAGWMVYPGHSNYWGHGTLWARKP